MKLTAQEEYGLRCLLQVAREEGDTVTLREVAAAEGLSVEYAGKLMRVLRLLPFLTRQRRKGSTGILPIDPREQELLDRQRVARGIHEEKRNG